jgi:hypothetical protein
MRGIDTRFRSSHLEESATQRVVVVAMAAAVVAVPAAIAAECAAIMAAAAAGLLSCQLRLCDSKAHSLCSHVPVQAE